MTELAARRGAHAVGLRAPDDVVDRLLMILPPYVDVAAAEPPSGSWLVAVGDLAAYDDTAADQVVVPAAGEPDMCYAVAARDRLVHVPDGPAEWVAQAVVRLVRALLRLLELRDGGVFVHGAMVVAEDAGVAYLGAKRAGKTTSALAMIAEGGGAFVSNDDLSLARRDAGWTGLGWPRSASVRTDTLPRLERLCPGFTGRLRDLDHPANDDADLAVAANRETAAAFVYPAELARALRVGIAPEATLHAVVLPSFTAPGGAPSFARLDAASAYELLLANLETSLAKGGETLHRRVCPETLGEDAIRARHDLVRRLADEVPCYRLVQPFEDLGWGRDQVLAAVAAGR